MTEYDTRIGAEIAALEEYGTEAFDADSVVQGNALEGSGPPNDPNESAAPTPDDLPVPNLSARAAAIGVMALVVIMVLVGGGD